jgi:predicted  nucleic acid-binding Zn-ribbon protein
MRYYTLFISFFILSGFFSQQIDYSNTRPGEDVEYCTTHKKLQEFLASLEAMALKDGDLYEQYAVIKNAIKDSELAIAKYKEQQNNVRNNREYESLSKEIEFQELEIKLHDKKSKEAKIKVANKKEILDEAKERFEFRKGDLKTKQAELDEIVSETQKDEDALLKKSDDAKAKIDDRLVFAYNRLRENAKNGLAVVPVDRDSCGGCFNKIPPQRQLDIQTKRKIIVCEHCGRILVPTEE